MTCAIIGGPIEREPAAAGEILFIPVDLGQRLGGKLCVD